MAIGAEHLEADMYFIDESGNYKFDASRLWNAHGWCLYKANSFLMAGTSVIVSNTFTTMKEMQPYFDVARWLDIDIDVIEMRTQYGSIHNVPEATMEKMRQRWVTLPENFNVKVVQ
jgi:hypothetical protein